MEEGIAGLKTSVTLNAKLPSSTFLSVNERFYLTKKLSERREYRIFFSYCQDLKRKMMKANKRLLSESACWPFSLGS